jgi:predicted metalloprotease with PDZ domain
VASVLGDGPARRSGIAAGDELLALDGFRVDDASLRERLKDYRPGDSVTLAVFRRDELVEVLITLTEQPRTQAVLKKSGRANVGQRTRYESWIGAPW